MRYCARACAHALMRVYACVESTPCLDAPAATNIPDEWILTVWRPHSGSSHIWEVITWTSSLPLKGWTSPPSNEPPARRTPLIPATIEKVQEQSQAREVVWAATGGDGLGCLSVTGAVADALHARAGGVEVQFASRNKEGLGRNAHLRIALAIQTHPTTRPPTRPPNHPPTYLRGTQVLLVVLARMSPHQKR